MSADSYEELSNKKLISPTISGDATFSGAITSNDGRFVEAQFFGSPFYQMKIASSDTAPTIHIGGAGINNFAFSVNAPGVWLGPGGSTTPDTNLYRSAADTLKTDDNLIVAAAGTAANSVVNIDATQTLTNKTLTSPVLNTGVSGTAVDTDGTLTANSDTILASQKAVKTYTDRYRDVSLIADTGGSTFNTSVAETSVLNGGAFSVPAGTLKSTGDRLNIKIVYYQKNNSGANVTFTTKIKFGGNSATVMNAYSQATNAFTPAYRAEITITRTSATTVIIESLCSLSTAINAGVQHQNIYANSWTVSDMDANALTFDHTVQMGTSSAQAEIDPLLVTMKAERI